MSLYVCVCEHCKEEPLHECSDSKFECLKVEKGVAKESKESNKQQTTERRAFCAG